MLHKKHSFKGGVSLTTTVLFVAAIVIVVFCATRFYDIKNQSARLRQEAIELAREEEELKSKIRTLQGYNEDGYDSDYVESMARQNLDMVYPGEIIFRTEG
ncbi:MAG: septum formation initiator family protein [Clostridia bacterium]|nr:septum formation initiator family protein [Clostridia bacterium]